MAAIGVNFKTLRSTAEGIKNFCLYQDDQMRQADFDIKSMLSSDWLGADALEFSKKWEGVYANGSQAAKLKNSLLEFGEFLMTCVSEYQKAQTRAIDEAITLRAALMPD